jgi:L-ascorbate metabolism protein UlaG (beta-lactamase superfamily)
MEVIFNWIGGASFILSIGNLNIAIDPVLCKKGSVQDYFWFKSARIEEPIYNDNTFKNIDLWLITHNHEDHLDSIGLSKIEKTSKVVSNKNASAKLKNNKITDISVLSWSESKKYKVKGFDIEVEAIPAIHGVSPISALMAGKVNGYYLTISDSKEKVRIYITGDTVYKNRVIKILKNKDIDLLIPNMGAAKQGSWIMSLTLNSSMLAKMISKLNPKTVIPVHYGTFEHYTEPIECIKSLNNDKIKFIDVGSKICLEY